MSNMAPYLSILQLRAPAGRREEAITQFKNNRVLETCQEAVPGFISGRLLRSRDEDTLVCVICEWTGPDAFEQWMNSPRRGGGGPDRIFSAAGRSALFELVQSLGGE